MFEPHSHVLKNYAESLYRGSVGSRAHSTGTRTSWCFHLHVSDSEIYNWMAPKVVHNRKVFFLFSLYRTKYKSQCKHKYSLVLHQFRGLRVQFTWLVLSDFLSYPSNTGSPTEIALTEWILNRINAMQVRIRCFWKSVAIPSSTEDTEWICCVQ